MLRHIILMQIADMDNENLWGDLKKFLSLQYDYVRLTALEKLVVLLSTLAMAVVLLVLIACVLFYLSFALVFLISEAIGCLWGAYLIVSGLFVALTLVVYAMRRKLIIDPVSKFLTRLFLDKTDKK